MDATKQNEELPPLPASTFVCKPTNYGAQLRAVHRALTTLENLYPLWAAQKRDDPQTLASHLHALDVAMQRMYWITEHASDFDGLLREVAARENKAASAEKAA
jgi:hypothetical protein